MLVTPNHQHLSQQSPKISILVSLDVMNPNSLLATIPVSSLLGQPSSGIARSTQSGASIMRQGAMMPNEEMREPVQLAFSKVIDSVALHGEVEMSEWSSGYVSELGYTYGFTELNPKYIPFLWPSGAAPKS